MDRHDVPGATAQDVADAHVKDLAVAARYGVDFFSYWFDPMNGSVFCFARAPSTTAVQEVHRESHGLIPAEIIEVSEADVVRFLGKVSDPANASEITSPFRTIAFTDLVDSTVLLDQLGDSQFMVQLTEHDRIIRRALLKWQGREVKHTGDGFLVSFAEVANALNWGLEVRGEFAGRSITPEAPPLRVRIGMAAGEPVYHDNDLFGATVHRANRICGVAPPGHVLVSDLVRKLGLEQGFSFGDPQLVTLKGFTDQDMVYELMVAPPASSVGAPLSGQSEAPVGPDSG